MTQLDPTKMADWQIAEAAEATMRTPEELGKQLGLLPDELIPWGRTLARVDHRAVRARLANAPMGRLIDVTAITPTPLGEGKTTTAIGLIDALAKRGHRTSGAIRQPSSGPTFNIKGSAAGGGLAQCIPLTALSMGLTGDIDKITNAHNLGMVALTARMQHERNYDDAVLAKKGLRRLDIDPERVEWKWCIDYCAQELRNIVAGLGAGKNNGYEMRSGFVISVSSELMAILAISQDLADLRRRIAKIVLAYDRQGKPVTAHDLEVDGAMAAFMAGTLDPTLMQTIEGNPVLVHAGPFANIAIGQSSVIADQIGTRCSEYHVTESGFAADIGYEKYADLKYRYSGIAPAAVVIVATIRALKMHGGGPAVRPGIPLDPAYTQPAPALLEAGCENLLAHIDIVRATGLKPVVCLNSFPTDTPEEEAMVRRIAEAGGAAACAVSRHWLKGGEGALELAEAVEAAADAAKPGDFHPVYPDGLPIRERIETIATKVYGADGVDFAPKALEELDAIQADPASADMAICMVKTQQSLSHDPLLKGRPRGWRLPVREIRTYSGAGFIVPVAGDINLMPGTCSTPAFRKIDVETDTGKIRGLY